MKPRARVADLLALAVVLLLGAPLVYLLAAAFADGEARRLETPLRALVGSAQYDALLEQRAAPQHYLQRPPLPGWLTIFPSHRARQDRADDRRVPDFSLPSSDGGTWRMQDQRGKVVVMNFWTVTCQPCVEEMPTLVQLSRILEERDDIELVTISTDRDWDTVRTVVPEDAPMTVLLDPEREVVNGKFGTRLFPETWVIDPDGVIRLRVDGSRDWASPMVLDVLESYL